MANFDEMAMLFAIDNIEEHERAMNVRQTRKNEIISDPFDTSDRLFIKNFRLTKDLVKYLIELLRPYIVSKSRLSAIDLNTKILVTLNFLATGSYQSPTGNSKFIVLSQPSVSRCISEVVEALNRPEIFDKWVKFPSNLNELTEIRNGFYRETGFPGVIGCIDCTHVAIVPPSNNLNLNENENPEYIYVNRKGYHSINVQLICDSKLRVLNVNALFPGSTHDTHIWNNSSVLPVMQELHRRNHHNFYLLGDSGYPLRQWLLTPITNPTTNPEKYYNQKQMSTRSLIERCNGVLKMRFRCLLKDRTLHYKPEKASSIINACIVLHNMCITNNIPLDEHDIPEYDNLGMMEDREILADNNRNLDLALGRQHREKIVTYLFQRHV
ncbi:putative nuclease HARBI1 [Metopolophium dirhodum]|uniref:putative nuclease HARBI1 n=1 Tax=Metopolophium dirhodum TaxID=44670 RepID=UPI00298F3ED0|nr:putative nuclease HARBI1 [Metopolophium dirhodum]